MIVSHKLNAGMPSMRNPASSDKISASYKPMTSAQTGAVQKKTPPEVDFESVRLPAKLASWNKLSLAGFAT